MTESASERRARLSQHFLETYQSIIPQAQKWLEVTSQALPTCFWVNTLKISTEKLAEHLEQDNISLTPLAWHSNAFRTHSLERLGKHWTYLAGLLQIQEEVSMLPSLLLDPKPHERVLDFCAAPGNKTAQLAVAMQNRGMVIANDKHYQRMRALGQICRRLGLLNISVSIYDGRRYPKMRQYFDKILVDAPCSCEGTFRKNKDGKLSAKPELSAQYAKQQLGLLHKAFALCKVGGRIVYSTCTFSPLENEAVIHQLLKTFPDCLRILPINMDNFTLSPGLTAWQGEDFAAELVHTARIWPHLNNTGGFYIAVLEKIKDNKPKDEREEYNKKENDATHKNPLSQDYLKAIVERFNFPPEIIKHYSFKETRRGLYCLDLESQAPPILDIDVAGLLAIKTQTKFAKLSTAIAMLWGKHAQRNKIELTAAQRDAYLAGQTVDVDTQQLTHCTDGYVLVNYKSQTLGMSLLLSQQGLASPKLRSLYPKAWQCK